MSDETGDLQRRQLAEEMARIDRDARGSAAWTADAMEGLLAQPSVSPFLSEFGHGFALWQQAGDVANLLLLCVRPQERRRAVGSGLMERAHVRLSTDGVREAVLEVAADNLAARALYHRFGYSAAGRRPNYYKREDGTRADALLLAKQLEPIPGALHTGRHEQR